MKRPNIIFILSDDQGAWALGSAGNSEIITPNLDKLAEKGTRYDNFFCASPVCSPARACIVTGTMSSCNGVLDWINGGNVELSNFPELQGKETVKNDKAIDYLEGQHTYIEQLAKHGYTCAHSGKWHLGASEKSKPGFTKWSALEGGGCAYFKPNIFENGKFVCHDGDYVSDVITDKAIEYLDELSKEDEPFYLSVHFTAPHSPWDRPNHPKKYFDMYEDCPCNSVPRTKVHENQIRTAPVADTEEGVREHVKGYYSAITGMDENIGRLMESLEKTGKADNTIVIFTGDNGMNLGHHGVWGKGNGTYPQNMFDSSVKVPFIIYSPFAKNSGIVNTNLHSHCDIYETLMELCDIKDYEKSEKYAGVSFADEVKTGLNEYKERDIMINSEYGAVRMLRTETRKLVIDYRHDKKFFYNLENDPNEDVNLIDCKEYQDEIAQMTVKFEELFDKYTDDKNDGRKYHVTGRGQVNLPYKENSFIDNYFYYYDKK